MTAPLGLVRGIRPVVARSLSRMVDLVLPARCALCSVELQSTAALCPGCWAAVDFIERPYCERLGIPFPYDLGPGALSAEALARDRPFDRVRSVARYRGPVRDLVISLKFADRLDLAPMMAAWMARSGADLLEDTDIVAPVPLHWRRFVRRRQNQSAMLARPLADEPGRRFVPDLLVRRRPTPPQTGLSASARARNVAGAFAVRARHRARLDGTSVLLVDDVFTTGSTVAACARVLRRAGAKRVDVLTFARVVEETQLAI